jgi:hypothetical protein
MAGSTLWTISIVMGLLAVAVAVASGRLPEWRRYTPSGEPESPLQRAIRSPTALVVGLLIVCTIGAAVVVVGAGLQEAFSGSDLLGGVTGLAFLLLLALPAAYMLWGAYDLARKRGLHGAKAVGLSAWIAGVLLVGLIAFTLVVA